MKKTILLTASALMFTVAGMAQSLTAGVATQQKVNVAKVMEAKKASDVVFNKQSQSAAPKHSFNTGVYYQRPAASLYRTFDHEGMGWSASILAVAPQSENKFINMCTSKNRAEWSINGTTYPGDEDNNFVFGQFGTIEPVDADGRISFYYLPTITVRTESYTLAETNDGGAGMRSDEVAGHMFFDDNTASVYGWGAYDTGFLYGSGNVEMSDGVYQGYGFQQDYPSPGAPLYVEDVYAMVFTTGGAPIAKDAVVYLTVLDKEGNEITTLTATSEDFGEPLVEGMSASYSSTGVADIYIVTFSKKEKDIFGNDVVVPFVVDGEFTVVCEGMNQEGVNMGFRAGELIDEDNNSAGSCRALITDGKEVYSFGYNGGDLNICLVFNSCYDYVNVPTELYNYDANGNIAKTFENTNVYVVSNDGQTGVVESTGEAYVYLENAFEWATEEGDENYYFEDMPEWVVDYAFQEVLDESGDRTGMTVVAFACEPLPADVEGRVAEIHVTGKGYTSENAIIIKQGSVKEEDGIAAVTVNKTGKLYNVAGQKVNHTMKGIVLDGSKKYVK